MSPAPDISDDSIIFNSTNNTTILHTISSSDELDHNPYNEKPMDLGSLTIGSMESIDLLDEGQSATLTKEAILPSITCSAPSTPTGERDPPVIFRRSSVTATMNNESARIEIEYPSTLNNGGMNSGGSNSDDSSGFLDTFLGCLKPIFSAVNKIGENIKSTKDISNSSSKTTDDWIIPTDLIKNDLKLIGTGIEGRVYLGKLNGQEVACKQVKTEEETNIKHLRKLNHINVIKFRGISISKSSYYIVMDYCPYGSLYEVLKRRRKNKSCTKPTQVLDWSKQISNGVNYLHANKIIHRDLKSPNILIAENCVLKISDFGTSKQLAKKQGKSMSLNGTAAWMAPEVIKQQPCSEKVDVWSFGIVLWEILTCEVPYENIDPNAIIWGVGKGSLKLPVPSSAPEGFKLLMTLCWKPKPCDRPSFEQIIKHLKISEPEIALFEEEQEYADSTRSWLIEIHEQLARPSTVDISSTLNMTSDELMKKRKEELQHIVDMRSHYQTKLHDINALYIELSSLMMQLQKREQEIKKKERLLNIQHHSSSINTNPKKRTMNSIVEARKRSLHLIKSIGDYSKDPVMALTQGSPKQGHSIKSNNTLSNNQISIGSHGKILNHLNSSQQPSPVVSTTINHPESSSIKTSQRRKKGLGHRRNNSKGSTTSWTPPSLSAIADQESKRASINLIPNALENTIPRSQTFNTPTEMIAMKSIKTTIQSISADIDSKISSTSRQLNPKNLKLDLESSTHSQDSSIDQPKPTTIFTYVQRKSSSTDIEEYDENEQHNLGRQRRRRNLILNNDSNNNNKISSPSSITQHSIKSNTADQQTPQIENTENNNGLIEQKNENDKQNDQRKYPRSVTFQCSPSTVLDRNFLYQQRKVFVRHVPSSSSEEGEVEEIPSDHYIFDDEKHRAKHEDLNRELNGVFSSESEIYNEHKSLDSLKNDGIFSDEGGHISDDRPESRGSLMNSEPEHEWHNKE